MDAESMQSIFDEVAGIKESSADTVLSILKSYSRWCRVNNYPGANDSMERIETPGVAKMRKCMVFSPLELAIYHNQLYQTTPEDKRPDNIGRGYDWLAFIGVKEEDVLSISNNDIHLDTLELSYKQTRLDIPKEARVVFKNLTQLDYFTYVHPYYVSEFRPRIQSDQFLRGFRDNRQLKQLRDQISRDRHRARMSGKIQKQLSFQRIYLSGLFYRAYEFERAGLDPSLHFQEEAIAHLADLRCDTPEEKKYYHVRKLQCLRILNNDYTRWKLAFVKL